MNAINARLNRLLSDPRRQPAFSPLDLSGPLSAREVARISCIRARLDTLLGTSPVPAA